MGTPGRRTGWTAVAALTLMVTAGCGLLGGSGDDTGAAPVSVVSADPEVVPADQAAEPESPSPKPAPSAKPKAKPKPTASTKSKAAPEATPTEDPNNFQEPDCAEHEGAKISKSKAKSALVAAAGKTYWPTSAPDIKISSDLLRSVAWHESGWQSDIVNCDGGRGLMQVMPDTEAFINQRFGQSYDSHDYRQNAVLGANYLAYLTRLFGDNYFKGDHSLSTSRCRSHSSMCLLNMVIAGYNAGQGAVAKNEPLPNPEYVDSVRSLMASCYCDRF